MLMRCRCCDTFLEEENLTNVPPYGALCDDCLVVCPSCGDRIPKSAVMYEDIIRSERTIIGCQNCYTRCYSCGRAISRSEAMEANGKVYCPDCVVRCPVCGVVKSHIHFTATNDGTVICLRCVSSYGRYCRECDDIVQSPETETALMPTIRMEAFRNIVGRGHYTSLADSTYMCNEHFGMYMSQTYGSEQSSEEPALIPRPVSQRRRLRLTAVCDWHEIGDGLALIRNYSYNPDEFTFFQLEGEKNEPFMGLELEADCFRSLSVAAKELNKLKKHLYMKKDGSLGTNSLEIVTMPATLAYHLTSFPWPEVRKAVVANGGSSHNAKTCGLHIHVNRSFFGNEVYQRLCYGKLAFLFHRFWKEMVVFARRTGFHYCGAPPRMEAFYGADLYRYCETLARSGRYQAVNLQKRDTVEFRLWRGTLKLTSLYATIEFTHALCHVSKTLSIMQIGHISWEELLKEIYRVRRYTNLPVYVKERGLEHGVERSIDTIILENNYLDKDTGEKEVELCV